MVRLIRNICIAIGYSLLWSTGLLADSGSGELASLRADLDRATAIHELSRPELLRLYVQRLEPRRLVKLGRELGMALPVQLATRSADAPATVDRVSLERYRHQVAERLYSLLIITGS